MVHRINIFLLSIILAVSQVIFMNQALAASLGGWTITNQIAQGASTVLNATKTVVINGANVVKTSTAKITPSVSAVSKVLARGAAGYALSVAVQQLLGAVDWVLDPANNQIRYKDPNASNSCTSSNGCGAVDYYLFRRTPTVTTYYTSADAACLAVASSFSQTLVSVQKYYDSQGRVNGAMCLTKRSDGSADKWGLDVTANPVYDPKATDKDREKTLSLDVVAQKVIDNAELSTNNDHKVGAQVATTTAAQDMLANDAATQSDVETQLNTNAKTQTSEQAAAESTPKDPAAPDAGTNIKITFPVFCSWAPLVCEAAQSAIKFPTTVTNWWETGKTKAETWSQSISEAWTATKEWMNEEETPEQITQVEIDQTVPVVPNNQYFNWGAYCPFTPGSQTISLEDTNAPIDYDLTSWCDMATDIRPFVLAAGALMSFLIASGIIMGRDD